MSIGDLKVVGGRAVTPTLRFLVDDRDTSGATATHKPGEPVKRDNANFVLLCATGDPEQGTDAFVGICANESTELADAEGIVDVEVAVPFITRIRGKAEVVGNYDSQSEFESRQTNAVTFVLTGSTFTINEDEGDDPNSHTLVVAGGIPAADLSQGWIDVYVKPLGTLFGNAIS